MSCAAADEDGDNKLLSELQRRLKPSGGGSAPKKEHLAVALLLARNPSLEPRSVWKSHQVSGSGDSRKRIIVWRDRIVEEGLLNACAKVLASDQAPVESIKALIVPKSWWQEHAPGIKELWYDAPVISEDQHHGIRTLHVRVNGCEELQHGTVTYDLPAEKHRDVHRRREEACIRSLDAAAADAHRARMSELQREQRLVQQTGDEDAMIRRMIGSMIAKLEREAAREQRTWHCPKGCAPGSNCARAAFRVQCLPPDDLLRQQLHEQWRKQHGTKSVGPFRGESGHQFVRVDEQARCHLEQEEQLQLLPGYKESFGDAEAIAEMKQDFLQTWTGQCAPFGHWCDDGTPTEASEYFGRQPRDNSLRSPPPDQFGYDHRPVGPIACARRGCTGCCYCLDEPAPARFIQVWKHGHISYRAPSVTWQTIAQLRSEIEKELSGLDSQSLMRQSYLKPVPVYLLQRIPDRSYGRDVVMCLSGAIRGLVTADELSEWSRRLEVHSIFLQVPDSMPVSAHPLPDYELSCAAGSRECVTSLYVYSSRAGTLR